MSVESVDGTVPCTYAGTRVEDLDSLDRLLLGRSLGLVQRARTGLGDTARTPAFVHVLAGNPLILLMLLVFNLLGNLAVTLVEERDMELETLSEGSAHHLLLGVGDRSVGGPRGLARLLVDLPALDKDVTVHNVGVAVNEPRCLAPHVAEQLAKHHVVCRLVGRVGCWLFVRGGFLDPALNGTVAVHALGFESVDNSLNARAKDVVQVELGLELGNLQPALLALLVNVALLGH